MNKRIPKKLQRMTATSTPANLLFFDNETKPKKSKVRDNAENHYLWFGYALAVRLEGSEPTRQQMTRYTTPAGFWDVVKGRLEKARPLNIFAHNLGFDLTVVDFWRISEQENWKINFTVLEDPPTFIEMEIDGCTVKLIDTLNYWRESLKSLGEAIGERKGELPKYTDTAKVWNTYCQQDVKVLAKSVLALMEFIRDNKLGKFAISIPSQAMNAYKSRFMRHDIFIHDNTKVLDMERKSYHGGLVHNFFIGDVKGKTLHHLDVNSLYPWCMLKPVPIRLTDTDYNPTVYDVKERLKTDGAVARVRINSEQHPFPVYRDGKLIEAIGKYTTELCGAELIRALSTGSVTKVEHIAFYENAVLFDEYVNFFYSLRKRYSKKDNPVMNKMAKLFMNSLYGKFAMLGYQWREANPENLRLIYESQDCDMPTLYNDENKWPAMKIGQGIWKASGLKYPVSTRFMSGTLTIKVPVGEHNETFPLISSYITSYAREEIRRLIAIAGERHCYYTDTDSLFVDDEGLRNLQLANCINDNELGYLKIEGKSKDCTFHCPKDYRFGKKFVCKGVKNPDNPEKDGSFKQLQFEGIKSVLKRELEPYIEIRTINKSLKRSFTKGVIQRDGWVKFIRITDND